MQNGNRNHGRQGDGNRHGNQHQPQNRAGNQQQEETPDNAFHNAVYNARWISEGADNALVTFAEKMGKYMAKNGLTNSKIRSIYGEIKRIQMGDFDREKASFVLLRPKVAYALGRDPQNKGLKLFKIVFDTCSQSVIDRTSFLNFCNLLEAILAYHKANGGKD
ncbi:type III-A CRISPR-associated protein Csm2 [Parabacteroides sp. OttesenSCG-928-N08]|nr:type III-A CRISPR-associated protein Csm2 [Parabacteroides sp. OttesenSCG-928-N08]